LPRSPPGATLFPYPTLFRSRWIGHHDSNVAEYWALHEALRYALELKATALSVFSASEFVVKQMTGEYACRSARLYSLHWTGPARARTSTRLNSSHSQSSYAV